jgi:hypothetical protein
MSGGIVSAEGIKVGQTLQLGHKINEKSLLIVGGESLLEAKVIEE